MSKTQDFEKQDKEYIANTYGRFNVCFEKGKGSLLWDVEGKEYIDLVLVLALLPLVQMTMNGPKQLSNKPMR